MNGKFDNDKRSDEMKWLTSPEPNSAPYGRWSAESYLSPNFIGQHVHAIDSKYHEQSCRAG